MSEPKVYFLLLEVMGLDGFPIMMLWGLLTEEDCHRVGGEFGGKYAMIDGQYYFQSHGE